MAVAIGERQKIDEDILKENLMVIKIEKICQNALKRLTKCRKKR